MWSFVLGIIKAVVIDIVKGIVVDAVKRSIARRTTYRRSMQFA
jgi:hypothetical protein